MKNKCKICGKPVRSGGLQFIDNRAWYHFMCLGYDYYTVRNLRAGLISLLCPPGPRKTCSTKYQERKCGRRVQVHLEDVCATDDDDDDDCNVEKLKPVISIILPPTRRYIEKILKGQRNPCSLTGCNPNADQDEGNDDDEDDDDNKEEEEDDDESEITSRKSFNACKKWCPKNLPDFSDDIMAEEKHQCNKDTLSIKSLCLNKKTQHDCKKSKKFEGNEDPMKIIDKEREKFLAKSCTQYSTKSTSCSIKTSEANLCEKPASTLSPKPLDQSVIEVLENVCYTAKQLHTQIRELICRIICKK